MQDHDRKYKDSNQNKKDENKKGRRNRRKKLVENRNTEDDVIFRGKECNIPHVRPLNAMVNY